MVSAASRWPSRRSARAAGAIGNDRGEHQAIEIAAQHLRTAGCQAGPHPRGHCGLPGAIELAEPARGGGNPVTGRGRRGLVPRLLFHPREHTSVERGRIAVAFLHLPVESARPPVEQAIAAGERRGGRAERRLEQIRRRAEAPGQEQPLAEADKQLEALAGRQARGIDRAQGVAGFDEVAWFGGVAIPLEQRARQHQARGIDLVGYVERLARRADRRIVAALVVGGAGAVEGAAVERGGEGVRGVQGGDQGHHERDRAHGRMLPQPAVSA